MGRWPQRMGYAGRGTDALYGLLLFVFLLIPGQELVIAPRTAVITAYCGGAASNCFAGADGG
jgi:hypothetical protein